MFTLFVAVLLSQQPAAEQKPETAAQIVARRLLPIGVDRPKPTLDSIAEAFLATFDAHEHHIAMIRKARVRRMKDNAVPVEDELRAAEHLADEQKIYEDSLMQLSIAVIPLLPPATSAAWRDTFAAGAKGDVSNLNPVQASIYLKSLLN